MPRLEARQIQKELESGRLWPVYWLHGQERMKSRELLRRIRKAALGDAGSAAMGFGEERLDGAEATAAEIIDMAQSLSLGGGLRFVVVRDAHLVKDSDQLSVLLGPAGTRDSIPHCCVFISKDLDGRKKFSKALVDKAAVVPCEEVPEEEREAWISYLARQRKLELAPELIARLRGLDPWSLDGVDLELEKFELGSAEVVLGGTLGETGADAFLDAFFGRDQGRALAIAGGFSESPDEALPLLGLLGWNVRQLALVISDRENKTRYARLSPFLAARFERWARAWALDEVQELASALAEVDFATKQTPKLGIGIWSELVCRFGK